MSFLQKWLERGGLAARAVARRRLSVRWQAGRIGGRDRCVGAKVALAVQGDVCASAFGGG